MPEQRKDDVEAEDKPSKHRRQHNLSLKTVTWPSGAGVDGHHGVLCVCHCVEVVFFVVLIFKPGEQPVSTGA